MSTSSPIPGDALTQGEASVTPAADLRTRLGLRATVYADTGPHPDLRPCPPWCWVAQNGDGHQHELMASHPMKALHHIEDPVRTVASMYSGESVPAVAGRHVRTATVELDLTQLGSADPVVRLYLRRGEAQRMTHEERLALTLPDARELAAALIYLVDLEDPRR